MTTVAIFLDMALQTTDEEVTLPCRRVHCGCSLQSKPDNYSCNIFFIYFVLGTSKMALFICVDCPCTVDILTFLHCDSLLFDVVCDSLEYIMIVVVHTS